MKDKRLNVLYRPTKFSDVVGQENAIKTLVGSILNNRVQNAYIFEGETGSGKTTTARIFSKSLICRNRDNNGEACGECDVCKTFESNPELVDVIEIDGGENRGIDKIRALKESLKYPPKEGYKVYIIDEFHMLTKESFTALLKPIEEPPKGVVFIFLTTEMDKIMKTIKNRCIKVKFNKLPIHLIQKRLKKIAIENDINCKDDVLYKIALASEGVMREAITILEEVSIMVNDREILESDLKGLINIEEEYIKDLIKLILNKDVVGLMECIDDKESLLSEADFNYIISRLRRYLYEKEVSQNTLKLISSMINVFVEYKNKVIYNISIKTLIELSSIDCIGLCSDNEESTRWLLDKFNIQDKDAVSLLLEKDTELPSENISKSSTDNNSNNNLVVSKDKADLFKSLMSIKFKEYESKFGECILEVDEENILIFTVDSLQQKKEITGFLKNGYAQNLKPICEIDGFIVKVG